MEQELQQSIWKFNFRPDTYLHASWYNLMPEGEVIQRLSQSNQTRGQARLVSHLMGRLGLADSVFFDFSKPLIRIALWSGSDIERLVLYLGAIFHARLAAKVIQRDDILKMQRIVGEDLFSFMQQRAGLLGHKIAIKFVLPQTIGLKTRIVLMGLFCLRAAFSVYPDTVWKRLMFKLEREWSVHWKRYATLGQPLLEQTDECSVLVQKVAIEIRMGMNHDGQILFS